MSINEYFDKIYVLNLHRRKDRLQDTTNRLDKIGINYEVFGATDGSVMNNVWKKFYKENQNFTTPNYLACSISHLSIYKDAIENNYNRILILEDDILVNKNIHSIFNSIDIPNWEDIFYLGYIPLSDDQSMWTYGIINNFISNNIFVPRNLWGLFAYGITVKLMMEILEDYNQNFPMEIDRYLVNNIQTRGKSISISPQLFCHQDVYSDNMGQYQIDMVKRSVDIRFANYEDYV